MLKCIVVTPQLGHDQVILNRGGQGYSICSYWWEREEDSEVN